VITQSVTIDVGGSSMPAYLARPDDGVPRPAVIVLQEIFGVNAEVKRITDLVASAGYVGLAINYYHRTHPALNEPYTAEGLQNGFKAAGPVTRAGLAADVGAAVAWLGAQPFVQAGKIATWGFCFGGTVAFYTATLPGIAAAIAFYGGHIANPLPSGEPEMLADAAKVHAPLLLAFGGQDDYIPPAAIEKIRTALTGAGKTFDIQVYPDQGHAFFRDSSAAMGRGDATGKAVDDAWTRVQAFLRRTLGG
jgi:carboxymethylenebutenolidase